MTDDLARHPAPEDEAPPGLITSLPDEDHDDPADRPPRRFPSSKRLYVFATCYTLFVIAVCTGWIIHSPGHSPSNFLTGFLVGATLATALLAFRLWQTRRPRP
ncbi:hypothetical protein [Actinomadura sp. NEAU-AAG7]|uniref:hypothetical protein n=1 Tax=Actinomadura sp. NEAU-AAG7 TaxID=2839640 RepID=UPI001BE3D163|nr:hypothetical protein [Actinomadura sp. NEAU-AAG7]MBT2212990.1 hypothetical protein [Actinomadura sp. NEAU-AAG7]